MNLNQIINQGQKTDILKFVYYYLARDSSYRECGKTQIHFGHMEPRDKNPYPTRYKNRNHISHKLARKELKENGFKIRATKDPESGLLIWNIKKAA